MVSTNSRELYYAGSVPLGEPTFVVETLNGHETIRCLFCGMVSGNANDVSHRYCGWCHHYHDMIQGLRDHAGPYGTSQIYPHNLDLDGCPSCHGREFRVGPRGGMNANVECTACRRRFNMLWGMGVAHDIPNDIEW